MAKLSFGDNKHSEGLEFLREALEKEPNYADAWTLLVNQRIQTEEPDEDMIESVSKDLSKWLEVTPDTQTLEEFTFTVRVHHCL